MISAAYITADVAGSTHLFTSAEMERLSVEIRTILAGEDCIFTFNRFDSIQVLHRDPVKSLWLVMQIRSAVRKFSQRKPDIRMCLGLGYADPAIMDFTFLKDNLFVRTGREFDRMAGEKNWFSILVTEDPDQHLQPGFSALGLFLDFLFRHITFKQIQVLSDLLKGYPQTEIARLQNKSVPTINKQVKALSWENFRALDELYRQQLQNQEKNAL